MTYTYIHTSPDFSHRVFQGAIRLITRPQEDQNWLQDHKKIKIDYKATRRTNWSRGSVTKENRISDQFIIRFITSLGNSK